MLASPITKDVSTYLDKTRDVSLMVVDVTADVAATVLALPEGIFADIGPEPVKAVVGAPFAVARRVVEDVTTAQRKLLA